MICEKRNGVATEITYDECGNILTKGGKTYAYGETSTDLLTSYDGAAISYGTGINKAPNPVVYRRMNLSWTKGRQLAAVSSNGKTITFSYNPKGIRTSKTVNGAKHDYVLEGTKLIRDVHNGVDYVYDAEDQVCGMVYEGNAYYFYKNLQGDVIAITNAKGVEIARYSYDAWGVCTITGLTELGGKLQKRTCSGTGHISMTRIWVCTTCTTGTMIPRWDDSFRKTLQKTERTGMHTATETV